MSILNSKLGGMASHSLALCRGKFREIRLQVKEIIYPLGASIDIRQVALGDQTMSVLEIWGAEYQENDCLLIKPDARPLLEAIAARERCIMQVLPLHLPAAWQSSSRTLRRAAHTMHGCAMESGYTQSRGLAHA